MVLADWIPIFLFGAGLCVAGYTFIYRLDKRVTVIEGRCVTHQAVIDSIANLNSKLDKLSNDNEMFWRILGPHLAGIIHSPRSVERDTLVDELVHGRDISEDDLRMLIALLGEAIESDRWTAEKRFAGAMLLARAMTLLSDKQSERGAA